MFVPREQYHIFAWTKGFFFFFFFLILFFAHSLLKMPEIR